ncbi:hypothetical protein Ciccas_012576, partial [Cichlidogyrus casuarinus]
MKSKILEDVFHMSLAITLRLLMVNTDRICYGRLGRNIIDFENSQDVQVYRLLASTIKEVKKSKGSFEFEHVNGALANLNIEAKFCDCEEFFRKKFCGHFFELFKRGEYVPTVYDPLVSVEQVRQELDLFKEITFPKLSPKRTLTVDCELPEGRSQHEWQRIFQLMEDLTTAEICARLSAKTLAPKPRLSRPHTFTKMKRRSKIARLKKLLV